MKLGVQEFDLTFRGVDGILPPTQADLAKEAEGSPIKRRVVAITAGEWNGTVFRPEEMDQIPANTETRRGRNEAGVYNVPLVLDHSLDFLAQVGTTFNIQTGAAKDKEGSEIHGLILDHEFKQITNNQKDVAAEVQNNPDGIYFSIRVRGNLEYDGVKEEYYWKEMSIDHNSIVTDPACTDTGIVGELSKSNLPLNIGMQNPSDMGNEDIEKRLDNLEQSMGTIISHFEKQDAEQVAQEQAAAHEDVLERADTIAAIYALDPEVNRAFLKTLSKEQLEDYKKDLERRKPPEESTDGKGQAATSGTKTFSVDEKAEKFLKGE